MIRVLYDHQKFSTQQYGGISRYFANIIQAIKSLPEFEFQLGVLLSKNHYIENEIPTANLIGRLFENNGYSYHLNQIYCKYLLKRGNFDVFHPTYFDPYFLDHLKKPLVVTVHDMTYERLPEYFWAKDHLTHFKRLNIERADRIIAISETTKNDLIKYSNVDADKITVVYHGMDLDAPFVAKELNIPSNYLLFVGDRCGYKNFYLFINAFKHLSERYPELNVVLTGGGTVDIAEKEYIARLNLSDRITHKNATDEELNFLYNNALAFVYPSLLEGFGLPILEAFTAKCPVVLSNTGCFGEIAADAALYFDPFSLDDLIAVLDKLISSKELRDNLVTAGSKRLLDFPLSTSIDKTLDIYRSLC